jgi:flagellar hook-associated protein 1 FlgK
VSTGYSLDPLNTGDNTAARDMAQVRALQPLDSGTSTIHDYYEATVSIIGVDARSNLENLEVEEVTIEDLQTRRLEISGVSLDEEVTNMIQFQRAFEASARMISVVDEMLQTVIALGQ